MNPPLAHILTLALAAQCPQLSMQGTTGPNCGPLGQAGAQGNGLSENGSICGEVSQCNTYSGPFVRFAGGPLIPLSAVGAVQSGRAQAVNSSGTVVGHVDTSAFSFALLGDNVTWLAPLDGHNVTEALSLNDRGKIVGFSIDLFGVLGAQAVYWVNGQPIALRLPAGPSSIAEGVNHFGQVCGWMGVYPWPTDGATPFIWHNGVTTALPLPAHAVNNTGAATAINNLGDACGYYFTYNAPTKTYLRQGCAWVGGQLIELGTLPGFASSYPLDINDAREIVGTVSLANDTNLRPFVWRDGVMHNLNDLVPTGTPLLRIARGVNNKGQIVGDGRGEVPNPHSIAVLLTPALPLTPGDVNCDGFVNITDLLAVIATWNPIGPVGGRPADLNRDNTIDVTDLIEVIRQWG